MKMNTGKMVFGGMFKLVLALVLVSFIASCASAATYYMSVDDVSLLSSGPFEGGMYSVGVVVTFSSPSGLGVSDCRARVSSLPSGWVVLDGFDSKYKSLSSCSGSTTFSVMPSSSGSFSGSQLVVEVRGTDSSGVNTVLAGSGSLSGSLVVVEQPVLDLSVVGVNSSSVSYGGSVLLTYRVSSTGGSGAADTDGLRLVLSSSPANALVFEGSGSSVLSVGSGVLSPGSSVTGAVVLSTTSYAVNASNITYGIEATSDNTEQDSLSRGSVYCVDCVGAFDTTTTTTSSTLPGTTTTSVTTTTSTSVSTTSSVSTSTTVPGGASSDVPLQEGWNLISLPLE